MECKIHVIDRIATLVDKKKLTKAGLEEKDLELKVALILPEMA